jgi:hypothetical protein
MINDFFDKVFVINLEERKDRLEIADCVLKEQGVRYERFPAIKDDSGIKGLVLTMRELFKKCLDENLQNVLILEDDFEPLLPLNPFLSETLPQLPQDYHCLYLGLNLLTQPKRISNNLLLVDQAYSSHAIAYSRAGIELIYAVLMHEEIVPYDILLLKLIQPRQKCYATYPMSVTQRIDFSNIENKITDWRSLMAMTFTMNTKNLHYMPAETIKCYNGHLIEGVMPTIDPSKLEVQNMHLIGKSCDCNRMLYFEKQCSCPGKPEWQIDWRENNNA